MIDIYFGLAIAAGISAVAFHGAWQVSRTVSPRLCNMLAIAVVLMLMLFIRDLWDSQLLARLLPFSNLIVIGNLMVPTVALLGGLAWNRMPGRLFRKGLLVGTMLSVAGYSLVHPLRGEVPHCENVWRNDVCLQSTNASCSPASAATLLRWYQIPATEQEMAELCLTRREGTHWQGLYRGLKLKTQGTPWDVEVFSGGDVGELKDKTANGPVILTVGIPKDARVNPVYEKDWGWVRGVSHSVVLFRFLPQQQVRVGDPSVDDGQENWTGTDLQVLWRGYGIRLVPRSGKEGVLMAEQTQPVSSAVQTGLPQVLASF